MSRTNRLQDFGEVSNSLPLPTSYRTPCVKPGPAHLHRGPIVAHVVPLSKGDSNGETDVQICYLDTEKEFVGTRDRQQESGPGVGGERTPEVGPSSLYGSVTLRSRPGSNTQVSRIVFGPLPPPPFRPTRPVRTEVLTLCDVVSTRTFPRKFILVDGLYRK